MLDGVPKVLPALSQAQEYQDRAARVGFDWPEIEGVLDKVREEIEEIKNAETDFELASEIGDLLFTIANIARKLEINPEEALQSTNRKFMRRFESMESAVRATGRNLDELSLEEMDRLWDDAKSAERD